MGQISLAHIFSASLIIHNSRSPLVLPLTLCLAIHSSNHGCQSRVLGQLALGELHRPYGARLSLPFPHIPSVLVP